MALGALTILHSNRTGIGYWTHFFLGALVPMLWLLGWGRTGFFLTCILLAYQLVDYARGDGDGHTSEEFALLRDVSEYLIGGGLVMLGSFLQHRRTKLE